MPVLKIRNAANNAWYEIATGEDGGPFLPTAGGTITGDLYVTNKQLIGGIGAETTAGTTDFNHVSNCRSGSGYTLLLGTATNGPGVAAYYHTFNFEYATKTGAGNMTQFAIPYGSTTTIRTALPMYRGRYSGTWTKWRALNHEMPTGSQQATYSRYGSPSPNTWRVWSPAGMLVYDTDGNDPRLVEVSAEQCDLTASGASGLDTGSEASNTKYYVHVIHNPYSNLTKTMFSLSYSAPTLPSGYTHFNVVDHVYNDSSGNLDLHQRWGDDVWLYLHKQVQYNITYTTSWQSVAWPAGLPYTWWTQVFLRTSNVGNAYPRQQLSSYGGIAWAQYNTIGYNYNVDYITRYHQGLCFLPIYSRASSLYWKVAWTAAQANNTVDVIGYRAPLYR